MPKSIETSCEYDFRDELADSQQPPHSAANKTGGPSKKFRHQNYSKNIYIGTKNAEKWDSIRTSFSFKNDVEFVSYLLKLAEIDLADNNGLHTKPIFSRKSSFDNTKLNDGTETDSESVFQLGPTSKDGSYSSLGHSKSSNVPSIKAKKPKRVQFQDDIPTINSPPPTGLLNRNSGAQNPGLIPNIPLIPASSRLFDSSLEFSRNSLDDSEVLDCRIAEKIKTELSEFHKHRANNEQELNLILNRNGGLLSKIGGNSDNDEEDDDDEDEEGESDPEGIDNRSDDPNQQKFYDSQTKQDENEVLCLAAMRKEVKPRKPRKKGDKQNSNAEKKTSKQKCNKLDVRRAPLGGKQFSLLQQQLQPGDLDDEDSNPENDIPNEPEYHRNSEESNDSIKVDLKRNCSFCDEAHTSDDCPLRNSTQTITDAIEKSLWIEENRDIVEKYASRLKPETDESEILVNEENEEDDELEEDDDEEEEDDLDSKFMDTNSVSDERIPKEIDNLPTFSDASVPPLFELVQRLDSEMTVVTRKAIPKFTKLGPLIGQIINVKDIPDDCNMRNIYEVYNGVVSFFLSTENKNESNWLRYIRPAPVRDKRNLTLVWLNHENNNLNEIYFVTCQDIEEGCELLFWSDDVNSAWGRKKIDKMNCGGCNIKFDHPLFYRTHCSVFHDPTFSLTIRKYHCKVCGIAVLGKENIMKHAAEMHDGKGAYQCQYCKKYFLRLNYLEMHRNYGCSANPHRARPLCDFCGRKFCQPQKLKVHIKRMHSDMADVLRDFQCKLCSKLLGSRAALQRHSKEVHSRNSTVVSCPRCQKLFQNRSNLKIHMLTHSGVRPFKCIENECNAAFTTKQCLQFHYKKVHGYTQDQMPKIERSIAYTFDAYSGGMKIDFINEQMPRRRRKSSEDPKGDLSSLVMDRPKKAKKNSSSSNDMDKFKSSLGDLCKNESNLSLLSSKISSLLNQELKNTKKLKKKTLNSIINNPELNPGCYNNESEQMKFLNTKKDIFSEENLNAFKMKLFQQPITEDGDLDDGGDDDDSKDSILGNQNNNNSQLNMVESFLTNSSAAGNLNMEPQNSLQMIQNQLNEQSHTQLPFHVNPLTSDNSFNINSIVRSKEFVAPSSAALLNSGIGLIQSKGSKKWINDSMNSDQQSSHQNQNSLMSSVNRDFLARLMMNGCNPQAAANAKYNQNLNEEHDDDSSTILDVVDNQNSSNHPSNAANLENQFSNHSSLQGQMGQLPNISSLPHSGAHSNHLSHNLPHLPLHQTSYSGSFYSSNDGQSGNHMSSSNNESVPTGPTSGPNPHNTGNSTASLLVEAALNSVSNMIDNNVDENRNESELNSMEVDIDSIPGEQGHNDQIQRSLQSNIQPGISDSQNPSHLSNHEMGSNIPENEGSFNDIHDIESNVKLMKSLNNFQMNNSSGNENLQFPLSQHSSSSSTNGNHNNNMACASNTNNEIIPENDIDVDSASTPRTIDRTDSNGFRNYQTTATPSPRDISPGQDYNQQHSSHMNSGNTSSMGQHQLFSGSPNLHRNSSNNFQQHNIMGSSSPSQPHPAASPPVIPRYGFTLNEICRKREFDQIHQSQLNIQQGLNPDRRDHNLSSDDDSIVIAQNLSVTNTSGNPNSDELLKLKMNPPLDLIYSKYNDQLNPSSDLADLRMKYNVNENSSLDMPEHFQRNVGSGLANPNNSSANSSGNDQINDIQGLDMSSRISGYPHHNFQLTAAAAAAAGLNRYHHHIYDILSERDQQQNQQQHHLSQADHQLQIQQQEQQMMLSQDDPHQLSNSQNVSNQEQDSTDQTTSVDLSRTASYVVTSPPSIPYASHPHSDMLRMVSLELNGGNSNPSNGGSNMIGTNNHRSFLSAQHNPRMDTMESLHHHHHRLLTTAEQHRLLASNTAAAAEQLTNPPNHRLLVDPAHLIMESNNRNLLSASAAETSRLLADSGVNHRHMVQSRDFGAYHHQVPPNNYHHHHPHHPLVRPSSLTSPGAHHSGPSSNYHPFPTYY